MPTESTDKFPKTHAGSWGRFGGWISRGGRLEIAMLAAIFLGVAGLWIFGVLAAEVLDNDTGKFDERILLALRQPSDRSVPIGPHWSVQVARDLTAFGSAVGIGIITAVVAGFLTLRRRHGFLTFVLGSVITGTLLSELLKHLFNRPRPEVVPHLTDISSSSFPSGHSMMSSIVYLTLAALLSRVVPDTGTKLYFFVVAVVLIGLIGCSRVYLGVHYPTDVLGGWCIGCVWAVICSLTAHFLSRNRFIPRADELSD